MKQKFLLFAVVVGLGFLVWDHFSVSQDPPHEAAGPPVAPQPLPTPRAVNEVLGRIVVDGKIYEEAVVRAVLPDSVSIRHRDGAATLALAEMPENVRTRCGYSPDAELAHAALKQAHAEYRRKVEAARVAAAAPALPETDRVSILEQCGAWVMAVYHHFFPPPAPPPLVSKQDPGFVRNRREVIAFYERAIAGLQELESRTPARARVWQTDKPRAHNEYVVPTRESLARQKQIADYNARIAALKAEIGE